MNYQSLINFISSKLVTLTGVEQCIYENQEINIALLKHPRIGLKLKTIANNYSKIPISERTLKNPDTQAKKIQVAKKCILQVTVYTLSDLAGMDIAQKCFDWFSTLDGATYNFDDNSHDVVVGDLLPLNNITLFIETDYQYRFSFDVNLIINDYITYDIPVFETIEILNEEA